MTDWQTAYDLAIKHLNEVKDERDAARRTMRRISARLSEVEAELGARWLEERLDDH